MKNVQQDSCITPIELKQLINTKKQVIKILDVRSKEEYEALHIPGAIHVALSEIETPFGHFDKEDVLITTCGVGGGRSIEAAEKLKEAGYARTAWLCGGTLGWTAN